MFIDFLFSLFLRKDKEAPWHKEFKRNQRRILINLHVLHPALRQCLSICKEHLNNTTLANCQGFRYEYLSRAFCKYPLKSSETIVIIRHWAWQCQWRIITDYLFSIRKPKYFKYGYVSCSYGLIRDTQHCLYPLEKKKYFGNLMSVVWLSLWSSLISDHSHVII